MRRFGMRHHDAVWATLPDRRLYRNPARGKVAGVCAGIADHLGVDAFIVRLGLVAATILFSPLVLLGYVVAAAALPVRPIGYSPHRRGGDPDDDPRSEPGTCAYTRPGTDTDGPPAATTLAGIKQSLQSCDRRVGDIETYVASREFELNRAIRELGERP